MVEFALMLFLLVPVFQPDPSRLHDVTIVGEVIDSKCYFTRAKELSTGPMHKECALECAKRGIPLAILEEKSDAVYFTVKERGNSGANDLLLPFVGERVEARGTLAEKGGARLLLVKSVEKAAPPQQ